MRCPDCASLRGNTLYKIPPARLALAAVAGVVTGIVGAFIMAQISFFVFFIGPIYGGIVAEAVLRSAGRKRGRVLEVIGVGGIVLGAIVVCVGPLVLLALSAHAGAGAAHASPTAPSAGGGFMAAAGLLGILWPLVGCGLGISTCYARLKYF